MSINEKEMDTIIKYQTKKFELVESSNSIVSLVNLKDVNLQNNLNSKLNKKVFAIKDNINLKDHFTTSGTSLLRTFKSPHNATVIDLLLEAGGIPIFKSNLDEFAMGGDGLKSAYGYVTNPVDSKRIVGGSSSGSAYLVKKGLVDFALGSDTGDSVRKPASLNGIVGFKPTWSLVSRYGISDFAPSLDTIGWFTKDVNTSALLADILVKKDNKDSTSTELKNQTEHHFSNQLKTNKKFNIAYSEQILDWIKHDEIKQEYIKVIEKLRKDGHIVEKVDLKLDLIKATPMIYRIISSVEGVSSNFKLNGWLYGENKVQNPSDFNNLIQNNRAQMFGKEAQKRFAIGTYYLQNIKDFINAKRIRFLIKEELNKVYANHDVFIVPSDIDYPSTVSSILENTNKVEQYNIENDYLSISNLTGRPSISIPFPETKLQYSVGLNINADNFEDLKVLQVAKRIEELIHEI